MLSTEQFLILKKALILLFINFFKQAFELYLKCVSGPSKCGSEAYRQVHEQRGVEKRRREHQGHQRSRQRSSRNEQKLN